MQPDTLSVNEFPSEFRRMVMTWYTWQGVFLWVRGKSPGETQRSPERWETEAEVFWGARPPEMVSENQLLYSDPSGEIRYYIEKEPDGYYIDAEERGSTRTYWMFRTIADTEKFALLTLSQSARPGKYIDSPRSRWRRQGLAPNVTPTHPDPNNYPGRVTLTVGRGADIRGWMGEIEAVAFSHAITLTYDELDTVVRAGIPEEAFTVASAPGLDFDG